MRIFAEFDARNTALVMALVGAVLGALVSISSVGAGAIGVMALVILYPRLSMVHIVGSDIAHAVPLTLIAGGVTTARRSINARRSLWMLPTEGPFALLTVRRQHLTDRMPSG